MDDLIVGAAGVGGVNDTGYARVFVSQIMPNVILGDVNLDGVVDFFDISPFISLLASQTFQAEADIDLNDAVDFFDIQPFIGLLSGQ